MKARIKYIWVALIILAIGLAIGQMAFLFASSMAKKPVERTGPLHLPREKATRSSVAVTVTVVNVGNNDAPPPIPNKFSLSQNYPNPFNANTMIRYDVAITGPVRLTIFNLLGQRVATLLDQRQLAGTYTISWDASNLPSGLYFCRMEAANFMQTRKMLLVK